MALVRPSEHAHLGAGNTHNPPKSHSFSLLLSASSVFSSLMSRFTTCCAQECSAGRGTRALGDAACARRMCLHVSLA